MNDRLIINVQQVLEHEFTLQQAKSMVIMHKGEAYTFFDQGNTRHVFVNADSTKVIKILQRDTGLDYNSEEVNIYQNADDEDKAKMVKSELSNGMVEQEFVTPIKFGGKRLSIAEKLFASKCRNEVGWDKDGNLRCYDLDEYLKY
jgi:hypothetical protein